VLYAALFGARRGNPAAALGKALPERSSSLRRTGSKVTPFSGIDVVRCHSRIPFLWDAREVRVVQKGSIGPHRHTGKSAGAEKLTLKLARFFGSGPKSTHPTLASQHPWDPDGTQNAKSSSGRLRDAPKPFDCLCLFWSGRGDPETFNLLKINRGLLDDQGELLGRFPYLFAEVKAA
jgi:hypothetical protein